MVYWQDKHCHSKHPSFILLYSRFYYWAQCHMVWDIHMGQSWSGALALYPPSPCALPASSLSGQHEKIKGPWLSVSTTKQQLKHLCVTTTIFIQKISNSVTQPLWRKLTVSQTKPWHWAFDWCHIPPHSQTTEGFGADLRKSQSSIFSQRRKWQKWLA